jgi:hypothetical protein
MGSLIEDEAVFVSDVRDADAGSGPRRSRAPRPVTPAPTVPTTAHPGHVDRPERGPVHELIGVPDQP